MNYETVTQNSDYKQGYAYRFYYLAIEAYEPPPIEEEWLSCPACGLRPLVWKFDNGEYTACGCGKNKYDHFTVKSESIGDVWRRTGGTSEYDFDGLRKNWNDWVKSTFGE